MKVNKIKEKDFCLNNLFDNLLTAFSLQNANQKTYTITNKQIKEPSLKKNKLGISTNLNFRAVKKISKTEIHYLVPLISIFSRYEYPRNTGNARPKLLVYTPPQTYCNAPRYRPLRRAPNQ